jgi:two-component system sensor histidine kinase KdpD
MRENDPRPLTVAARIAAVLAMVAAITFVCFHVLPVNAATVGFAYLVAILFVAVRWGMVEATVGSIAAVLCFNFFFLPPIGTFTIADPQNWVAFVALLATSITASRLSAQIKRRTAEAQDHREEMERLYALSRSILLMDPSQPVSKQLAHQVAQAFGASSVALFDRSMGEFYHSGPEEFPGMEEQLRQSAIHGTQYLDPDGRTLITAVRLGAQPIGSLGIAGVELSDSALQGLANLVAIGLERARAQESASRAEAARQSEELKSTLLDAVAHEFKTPLTAIKASTTALLSDHPPPPEQQRAFIAIVDEEAQRLSVLVTDAIQMARIEAGRLELHREDTMPDAFVTDVLDKMRTPLDGRVVQTSFPPGLPSVAVDRELLELAFRNVIDNAIKYSQPNAPLVVSAVAEEARVVISVKDQGAGIPEPELHHIFDRFYRSKDSRDHIPGAGLGLAIAREIVRLHGGDMWAESKPRQGSIFHFSLPLAAPTETT